MSGTRCTWQLPVRFDELTGLATLGLLKEALSSASVRTCSIDMGQVIWADPVPLLCLGLVLAESDLAKQHIEIDLGNMLNPSSDEHRVFLKFLAQQAFVTAFGEHTTLVCDGAIAPEPRQLRLRLASEPRAMHYRDVDCISARLQPMSGLRSNSPELQVKVEELLQEAQDRSLGTAFGAEPRSRDMLFQKLRKLLFELLSNIAEHSHASGIKCYAGLYARIRGAKPRMESDAKAWSAVYERGRHIPGQSRFTPNPYSEWLELFICDVGVGLTSQIDQWQATDDPEANADLNRAKASYNPLESIALRLFRSALSRHVRHDANRTAVTGLQHLGHLLAVGGDYCRIYSQSGCWIGGHVPWRENYSRKDIRTRVKDGVLKGDFRFHGLKPVNGTCYAFSIQPLPVNAEIPQDKDWCRPTEAELNDVRSLMRTTTVFAPRGSIDYLDRRRDPTCSPDDRNSRIDHLHSLIVRPPRLISKIDLSLWLLTVAGHRHQPPTQPIEALFLVDLTPFQALAFKDILVRAVVHQSTELDIFLVTEAWSVSCLSTRSGETAFSAAPHRSRCFMSSVGDDIPFTMAELAVLLRQMDSKIFWRHEKDGPDPFFFEGEVDWYAGPNKNTVIHLPRYLDFPRALTDPTRYRACRRALRRCLALYPGRYALPADDFVRSILQDVVSGSYDSAAEKRSPIVIVGSVAVTAGTVTRAKPTPQTESLHVMLHDDVSRPNGSDLLGALLWISQLRPQDTERKSSTIGTNKPWRRIPGTPYIAPLGERSISILRYPRRLDGSLDFSTGLYERTPEQTYADFQRLNVLKVGHRRYRSRHEMLSINLRLAFQISFLELGPLYTWMQREFKSLFAENEGKGPAAQLLIYPSHPVTDMMLDRIRQDPGFKRVLPAAGMIPIKFVGSHTVSPLFASHLVAYQIQQELQRLKIADWAVVVFDDSTVGGKHMRELTEFAQALGASQVYTLALLDRTSLPAHEAVINEAKDQHRRFWRWDVPTLGHSRECPLCQALELTHAYAARLADGRQKNRLEEWTRRWRVLDVDTQWHHEGGLPATPLNPTLQVTFGVDVDNAGVPHETRISFGNSTSATAVLMELTRLTTRADVALKKSVAVENRHPDAAIEMIACQLLLFFEEFTPSERHDRFVRLLELIWSRDSVSPATSLAGLCLTLAERDVMDAIWDTCETSLVMSKRIGNLDAILAANMLRSKHAANPVTALAGADTDIAHHNYLMLGSGRDLRRTVRDFLHFNRNPNNPQQIFLHDTESRHRLMELAMDRRKTRSAALEVLSDLREIEKIAMDLHAEKVCTVPLDEVTRKITQAEEMLSSTPPVRYSEWARETHELLYGASSPNAKGVLPLMEQQLLFQFADINTLDNALIAPLARDIASEWPRLVTVKGELLENSRYDKRWRIGDEVSIPTIFNSDTPTQAKHWMYCDTFVRYAIRDVLANVYYAVTPIADPWNPKDAAAHTILIKADMWWRFQRDGDFALLEFANASASLEIEYKETVNISGLTRVGGTVKVEVERSKTASGRRLLVAYTTLRLPLHSAFMERK